MKKNVRKSCFIRLLALLCTLLLLPAGAALAQGESFGVISGTDTLNLRSRGSSSSDWLGSYPQGTWLAITGAQNNFYYVTAPDGKTGYMSKNFIDTTGDGSNTHQVALVTNQSGGAFLNFRLYPSYDSKVLGIFYYGVPLYVLGASNGWYNVKINGQTGYVRSEYITLQNVPASTVVATVKTPNSTAMNLRRGPGSQYGVIKQFSGDSYVMVLAKGTGWWRVSVGGYTGFMSKDYLVEGLHAAKDIAAQNEPSGGGESYAMVNNPKSTQALNLRLYASTGSEVLGKLYNGTRLSVDRQGSEWSAVTVQQTGLSGYVMTRYLRLYNLPTTPTSRVYHPNGSYVNLRSQADMMTGAIVARVPSGKTVTVLVPGAEWSKVKYNGYTGYMLTYFLR